MIISNLFIKFLPVFIFASLIFGVPIPQSPSALGIFVVSVLLGFLILWLINAIFGLFSFWIIERPIGTAKAILIRFLSGGMIPLWFFPNWLSGSMKFLPFIYIYQSPISVYIGKVSINEGWMAILIQLIWIAVLFFCMLMLQRKAFKNVIVQGG